MRGPKISKVGHVTQATPTYESFCGPDAVGSVLYVCAKFESDIFIRSKVIRGGPKISKLGHVTEVTPTEGSIYGLNAVGDRPLGLCQI